MPYILYYYHWVCRIVLYRIRQQSASIAQLQTQKSAFIGTQSELDASFIGELCHRWKPLIADCLHFEHETEMQLQLLSVAFQRTCGNKHHFLPFMIYKR